MSAWQDRLVSPSVLHPHTPSLLPSTPPTLLPAVNLYFILLKFILFCNPLLPIRSFEFIIFFYALSLEVRGDYDLLIFFLYRTLHHHSISPFVF